LLPPEGATAASYQMGLRHVNQLSGSSRGRGVNADGRHRLNADPPIGKKVALAQMSRARRARPRMRLPAISFFSAGSSGS
jgi:hypothetical protein